MDGAVQSAMLLRGGGEDNESGARAYLVTVPSARSGSTIAKSGDDKGRETGGSRSPQYRQGRPLDAIELLHWKHEWNVVR